jgi:hypothetical protein
VDIAFQTPAELGGRGDRAKPLLWLPNNAGWVVNSGLIVTAGNGPATAIARLGLDRVQSVEFSNDGLLRGIEAEPGGAGNGAWTRIGLSDGEHGDGRPCGALIPSSSWIRRAVRSRRYWLSAATGVALSVTLANPASIDETEKRS